MKRQTLGIMATILFWVLVGSPFLKSPAHAQDASRVLARYYYVDVHLFSSIPGEGIASYRGYGGVGGGAPNATLGLSASDERQFDLTVETTLRSKEFVVVVRVEPKASDERTESLEREFVLSDLQPQTIRIARNDDGRIYQVNLYPQVREIPKPRLFEAEKLHLDHWSFQSSPIIVNDQDYVGRMSMSSGQLAFLDLSGLAKIEFALLPFRDAKSMGSLKDGIIDITHESGTSLRISDVTNGVHREVLTGGPYQVFVRWSKPSMSDSEYRMQLDEMIAHVKERIASGDLPAGKNFLRRLERAQNSDRVMMMTSGLGAVPPEDIIHTESR